MSRHAEKNFPRVTNEAYYTPPHVTASLLAELPIGAFTASWRVIEPAAGAGHMAHELARAFDVEAFDISPPQNCVFRVWRRNFLKTDWYTADHTAIITNPPYGFQNRLAETFLRESLEIVAPQKGLVALLLPFEFDAAGRRHRMVGGHPAFAAKITIAKRIRWLNVAQKINGPMSHHSWFVWSFNRKIRRLIMDGGVVRTV